MAERNEAASRIELVYEGTTYTMEFDRSTVLNTEKTYGLSMRDVQEGKLAAFDAIFRGAFLKHHPRMKPATVEAIMDRIPNKSELYATLVGMYSENIESLLGEPEEGKAISWAAV